MASRPARLAPSIPEPTLKHFQSIPWVATHLSNPTFHPVHLSRTLTHHGTGHTLMAATWNTPETITHILSLYRPPLSPITPSTPPETRAEIRRFYTIGSGLNAHPHLLHGGVIASILDSTLGNVIGQQLPDSGVTFTVKLTVDFKKPVRTPGTVMARAWIVRVEGRKIWVRGEVCGEGGEVHAEAEGLWLRAAGGGKL